MADRTQAPTPATRAVAAVAWTLVHLLVVAAICAVAFVLAMMWTQDRGSGDASGAAAWYWWWFSGVGVAVYLLAVVVPAVVRALRGMRR